MPERNIRSIQKYQSTFWDWTFLNPCFMGTNIAVEDIDGHVEYRGYHLYLETKLPGNPIPKAQEIVHLTLQAQGINTILCVWGERNESVRVRLYAMGGMIYGGPASNYHVALIVRAWFDQAKRKPRLNVGIPSTPIDPGLVKDIGPVLSVLEKRNYEWSK